MSDERRATDSTKSEGGEVEGNVEVLNLTYILRLRYFLHKRQSVRVA